MREAEGSALLLNIVIVFIGVISAVLVSSIAYSKAFKAKNQIISTIENYNGECTFTKGNSCFEEIERKLTDMGYSSNITKDCPTVEGATNVYGKDSLTLEGHKYCIYRYEMCDITTKIVGDETKETCDDKSNKKHFYKVITFMHFDFPLVGQFLEFEVSGETRTFYDTFVNIKS